MQKESLTRKQFLKFAGIVLAGGMVAACTPEDRAYARLGIDTSPTHTILPDQPVHPVSLAPDPTQTATLQPTSTASKPLNHPTQNSTTTGSAPSATPTETQTPTASLASASFEGDILTPQQKQRLYQASLKYIADTEEKAIQIARSLAYVQGDGHPSTMCGPLAIAILRDAGLVSKYTDLHDFWLLNPRESLETSILEEVFPRDQYLWFQTRASTGDFDFKAFPLKAGDFMYLYAGNHGSFEHMLTVNRVDAKGRVYSITNIGKKRTFVIQEVMLYDPTQPGTGLLYDWLDREKNPRYRTGSGGFDLWRHSKPVPEMGAAEIWLADQIDAVIDQTGGDWKICFQHLDGQSVYWRNANQQLHAASIIKIPIALLFFKSCEIRTDDVDILSDGINGRTYDQLLHAMLVFSEEDAAESLLKAIQRNGLNVKKTLQSWGLRITDVQTRQSTAEEIVKIFRGLYTNQFISLDASRLILKWMSEFTEGDRRRLGVISSHLPPGDLIYNKRGTITENYMVVADAAILTVPTSQGDQTYILDVFSLPGKNAARYEALEQAIEKIANLFWEYTQL